MFVAFAWAVAISIASALISYALTPKPKAGQPPSAQTITTPQLDAGTPIQVVFGRMRIRNPNTLGYGGDRTEAIRK